MMNFSIPGEERISIKTEPSLSAFIAAEMILSCFFNRRILLPAAFFKNNSLTGGDRSRQAKRGEGNNEQCSFAAHKAEEAVLHKRGSANSQEVAAEAHCDC